MKEGLALEFHKNKLIFFGFKKNAASLSSVPDIIRKEFKDAQVINEHNSKEKVIYQVYLYENDIEFTIRIIASYFNDSITIIADEVNITIRAYQALHKKLANGSLA
ncbi:hypothetical protein [Paenibacillus kribbensis]|uniref:hypothetical protein n=1 Tax=Paenibacillus kribbensis TaxID=172713 RepID=UPI000838063D|nr:hypothetical protein [Paenibacillus kribbensis]